MGIPWSLAEGVQSSNCLIREMVIAAIRVRLHAKVYTVNSPIFKGEVDCVCCKDSGNYTRKLVVDNPRELS